VWWHLKQTRYDKARNAAAEKVQLGRVRSHDLRHTAGSLAHASGASGPEVRDLLGHSTLAMVSRYGHSYGDRLAKVATAVEIAVSGTVPGELRLPGGVSSRSGTGRKSAAALKGKRF
jgi:integrase